MKAIIISLGWLVILLTFSVYLVDRLDRLEHRIRDLEIEARPLIHIYPEKYSENHLYFESVGEKEE